MPPTSTQYECNTSTGTCEPSTNGKYSTKSICTNDCKKSSPYPITIKNQTGSFYFLQQQTQTNNKLPPCITQPLVYTSSNNGFKFSNVNESNRVHILTKHDQWPTNQTWPSQVSPPSFYKLPKIKGDNDILNISVDVNLQETGESIGAECGSVLAIYLVPTRDTPAPLVDENTNTCTDFYMDGAGLCGKPPVQKTCGAGGNPCTSAANCSSKENCGLYHQTWPCKPGLPDKTGCNMGVEIDLFEGNKYGFQSTTHNCIGLEKPPTISYEPTCDQWGNTGTGLLPRNEKGGWKLQTDFGPGNEFTINTLSPFTVSAKLSLKCMIINIIQGAATFLYGKISYVSTVSTLSKATAIKDALQAGDLSLIFSYWANPKCNTNQEKNCGIDPDSMWLTKQGPGGNGWQKGSLCAATNKDGKTGPVTISNITVSVSTSPEGMNCKFYKGCTGTPAQPCCCAGYGYTMGPKLCGSSPKSDGTCAPPFTPWKNASTGCCN
jgi:hypothetical protein